MLALDGGPAIAERLAILPDATVFADADGLAALLRQRLTNPQVRRRREWSGSKHGSWETTWRTTALPALLRTLAH